MEPAEETNVEKKKVDAALNKLQRKWGKERVQAYKWSSTRRGHLELLASVCGQVETWEEFVIKLNQLLVHRHQRTGRGKRNLRGGVDRNVLKWKHRQAFAIEGISLPFEPLSRVPTGFDFDKYRIIIKLGVKSEAADAESPSSQEPSKATQQLKPLLPKTVGSISPKSAATRVNSTPQFPEIEHSTQIPIRMMVNSSGGVPRFHRNSKQPKHLRSCPNPCLRRDRA